MTETIKIEARGLRPGDVWLGDDTELRVNGVRHEAGWKFVPWFAPKNAPAVEMWAVHIAGTFIRYGTIIDGGLPYVESVYSGSWILQADQPLEVRRG